MSAEVAIGVDVGGTKIAVAAVDIMRGDILHRLDISTQREQGGAKVLERLYELVGEIHTLMTSKGIEIAGVGIGVPELVDNSGNVQSAWNFDWNRRNVNERLSIYGQIMLESDARTGALAESQFGHGVEFSSFIFITVGTGLSSAFFSDGKIHRGANGYAIHFASSDIMAMCRECGAQTAFNLEAFASGDGLAKTYRQRTGNAADARAIVNAEAGDAGAEILDQATTALASYIGQLINVLDPHAVIVGGGLGTAPEFFRLLEKKIRPFIWAQDCRSVPIRTSRLGAESGVIGAATLFLDSTQ